MSSPLPSPPTERRSHAMPRTNSDTRSARRRQRRVRRSALLAIGLVMAVISGVIPFGAAPYAAAQAPITGSGSTFAEIAINQWRADAARSLGIQVNYQGTGSTAGRNAFTSKTVDFASSDIQYEEGDQIPAPGTYTYLPLVAGGTALMYNLRDPAGRKITTLKLTGRTAALVFTGEIRNWRDPAILADNPDLANRLPDRDIKPVVRTGGSGTTAVFTSYLGAAAPAEWGRFVGAVRSSGNSNWVITDPGGRYTSRFPINYRGNVPVNGSDGVSNFVASFPNGEGSIGYAEAGYAIQSNLSVAYIKNSSGAWTQPTARAVAIALTRATRNPDGTQNLNGVYGNPNPESYPISSYNYLIAPVGGDASKGETLRKFVIYSVTEGQRKAEPLGYSPLPKALIGQAFDALRGVAGTTQPPPLASVPEYYEALLAAPPPPAYVPEGGGSGDGGGSGPGGGNGPGGGPSSTSADAAETAAAQQEAAAAAAAAAAGAASGDQVLIDGKLVDLALKPQSAELIAVTPVTTRWWLMLPALVLIGIALVPPIAATLSKRRRTGEAA
jgi:phosphate transport system substrate-binding protein